MLNQKTHELLVEKGLPAPKLWLEKGLKFDIGDLLAECFDGASFAVIDDNNTSDALGNMVFRAVAAKGVHITLPKLPRADDETAAYINARSKGADVLLAVGSGTINDLCKYASHQSGRPYAVFPTAASMNGYLSANASITCKGHKTTLPAHMPRAVICDRTVIAEAPARLSQSGFGDSMARSTAQSDWLLSRLLLSTPYDETPFSLITPLEPELHDAARGIALGDEQATQLLMQTLLLSGLGMTFAGGSYPASQGEHMIAHTHEMLGRTHPPLLHGEEIAVTSLHMAALQDRLLASKAHLAPMALEEEELKKHFGPDLPREFRDAFAKKQQAAEMLHGEIGQKQWEECRERIAQVHLPERRLRALLEMAGCPTTPQKLGWTEADLRLAASAARFTRERFTFLDLV